uniref:Uncharacterized protein n=1 Tax=Wuchereria bancrofti TaxID=6293 RepID=A0AAF5Q403_WUCBA
MGSISCGIDGLAASLEAKKRKTKHYTPKRRIWRILSSTAPLNCIFLSFVFFFLRPAKLSYSGSFTGQLDYCKELFSSYEFFIYYSQKTYDRVLNHKELSSLSFCEVIDQIILLDFSV